jgi:hypothetical protein
MSGSMPALPMGADSAMTLIPTKRSDSAVILGEDSAENLITQSTTCRARVHGR